MSPPSESLPADSDGNENRGDLMSQMTSYEQSHSASRWPRFPDQKQTTSASDTSPKRAQIVTSWRRWISSPPLVRNKNKMCTLSRRNLTPAALVLHVTEIKLWSVKVREKGKGSLHLKWDPPSSGMSHIAVFTDVSGQPTVPIFKGIDRLSRDVGNYQSTLHNIPEERGSHLHRGRSLRSYIRNLQRRRVTAEPQ